MPKKKKVFFRGLKKNLGENMGGRRMEIFTPGTAQTKVDLNCTRQE